MTKARHYLRLLADARTVIRTIRQVYGTPRQLEVAPYQQGEAQRVAGRVHPPWITVRVEHIRVETPSTRTLVVGATGGSLPPFVPGQYVNIFVEVQGVRTSRPMSISAPPRAKGTMELTIKRKQGGFVSGHLLDELQVGDELQISGPEGDFQYQRVRDGNDLVFIAAGSGVTPFMGMIEYILERRAEARIGLLYGSRSADEIIFHDRLQALAARHQRLRMRCTLSAPALGWGEERGRSFSTLARGLARLPIERLRRWLSTNAGRIAEVDQSFVRVYRENRRRLPAIFVVLLVGWAAASVESYVLLRALDQPVGLPTAVAIESVGSMFRLFFFLVPSGIGGQDASQLALFKLFHLPKAAGGAFVLIKRVKELCWIGLGFVLIMVLRKKGEAGAQSQTPAPSVAGALPASPRVV